MSTFTCEKYHTDMPAETQVGFCARRFRIARAGDYCLECETGKQAAKTDAEAVRSGLPETTGDKIRAGMLAAVSKRSVAGKRSNEIRVSKKNEREVGMATGVKMCVDCGEEYKPTSNVQKRCVECKAKKKEEAKASSAKSMPSKRPKAEKRVVERKPRKASVSQSPRRNGEAVPASYLVEIDFSSYPKLHDRLLNLSSKEHRSPDMQLVHMLDETFSQAEAGAGK